MSDKTQLIDKLARDLEKEKKRTRWFSILEMLGFVILIIGFIYLFIRTSDLRKDEQRLQKEVTEFQLEIKAANEQIARKEDSLSTLGANIVHAINLIDTENVDSARSLLGLAKKDYVDKINSSILGVNEMYIGDNTGKKLNTIRPGRIYVWAYINSPNSTIVSVNWISEDGHTWAEPKKDFEIGINTQRGFKISVWRQLYHPGDYKVQVLGPANQLLQELKFRVVAS